MNKLITLAENLNYLLKEAGINAAKLARDLDFPGATIKNLRCGDNKNPTLSTLQPIAKYFSITTSQLIGEENIPKHRESMPQCRSFMAQIPLLSWENATSWSTVNAEVWVDIIIENPDYPIHFALMVYESDLQNFPEKSLLLINTTHKPEHKDFVIVQKQAQKAVLRQFFDEGDGVYLKSLFKESPFIPWSDEHTLVGVVYSFQKKLK